MLDCEGILRYNNVLHMTFEDMVVIWIIHGKCKFSFDNQINKTISFLKPINALQEKNQQEFICLFRLFFILCSSVNKQNKMK